MIALYAVGVVLLGALGYGFYKKSRENAVKTATPPQRKITPATAAGAELQRNLSPQQQPLIPPQALPLPGADTVLPPSLPVHSPILVRQSPPPPYVVHPTAPVAPVQPKPDPEETRRAAERAAEEEAIKAPTAVQASATGPTLTPAAPATPPLPSIVPSATPLVTPVAATPEGESAAAKLAFLESARKKIPEHYLKSTRQEQLTPYEIKAGWEIPAILEQALNSDLPGDIKALVRENVYDTGTGRYLLIPQGTRAVGSYNSRVDYGQDGLQVIWDRLIYPDGSSLDLGGMNGLDSHGRAGLRHDVDNHYKRLFGMAALTSAFAAVFAVTQRQNQSAFTYPTPSEAAGQEVARQMALTGQQITRKNLNVSPTIKVPLGYTFTVRVNRDIVFTEPYHPQTRPSAAPLPVAVIPAGVNAQ